jgi:Zn-dependent protease with chaperone function
LRFRRHREDADSRTGALMVAFALTVVALVAVVNLALALAWRLTLPVGAGYPRLFFETNTLVVLMLVLGGWWVESRRLRQGGAVVARWAGARVAADDILRERRLVNVVQEASIAARRRPPEAWVLPEDDSINAFVAGWRDEDTVIVVTRGALARLTRAELQGVVAHELGHLASGDTHRHMKLIGLVWGLQMVHGLGVRLMQPGEDGKRPAGTWIGLALRVSGYAGWLAGRLLQAAIARQREFHADAAAVQFTRQVDGLGGALRKIAGPQGRTATRDAVAPDASLACLSHLWIAEPWHARWSIASLLSTHPPLAERLRRLYGRTVSALPAPELPEQPDSPGWPGRSEMPALQDTLALPAAPSPERWAHAAGKAPEEAEAESRTSSHSQSAWPPWPDTVPSAALDDEGDDGGRRTR